MEVHTFIQSVNPAPLRQLIRPHDTGKNRQKTTSQPPPQRITQKVNLLLRIILRPKTHAPQEKRPLNGLAGVRMTARQRVVVVEHGSLEFKVLFQKGQVSGFLRFADATRAVGGERGDVVDVPHVARLLQVFVAVDFGLLEGPFGERGGVRPHGDFGRVVDELELAGHGFEILLALGVFDLELEECVVVSFSVGVLDRYGGELLVGGVVWRGHIVTQ